MLLILLPELPLYKQSILNLTVSVLSRSICSA
jgi:hypothetical protein